MRLCTDMVYFLNDADMDPSYYSVFRDLLEEWVLSNTSSSLSGFNTSLNFELCKLSKSVDSTTGINMDIIWEATRPFLPSSLEQWNVYDKLQSLMNEFETKSALQIGIYILLFLTNSRTR
jgi:midasin (ATPase involved in ribosome maturation)